MNDPVAKELQSKDYEETSFGASENTDSERTNDVGSEEFLQHHHDDIDSNKILFSNIAGMIRVVSAVPTNAPRWINEQIAIYVNGATMRLYVYDWNGHAWHYATLT